jgi:hypothetical protein
VALRGALPTGRAAAGSRSRPIDCAIELAITKLAYFGRDEVLGETRQKFRKLAVYAKRNATDLLMVLLHEVHVA